MMDCCVHLCHDQNLPPCSQIASIEKPTLAACLLMLTSFSGPHCDSRLHLASNSWSCICTTRHVEVQIISSKHFLPASSSSWLFSIFIFLLEVSLPLSCRLTSTPTQFAPSKTPSRRRALPKPAWAHGLALLMTALS